MQGLLESTCEHYMNLHARTVSIYLQGLFELRCKDGLKLHARTNWIYMQRLFESTCKDYLYPHARSAWIYMQGLSAASVLALWRPRAWWTYQVRHRWRVGVRDLHSANCLLLARLRFTRMEIWEVVGRTTESLVRRRAGIAGISDLLIRNTSKVSMCLVRVLILLLMLVVTFWGPINFVLRL